MRITEHAKMRARQYFPEMKYCSEQDVEDFLTRVLQGSEILTPEEIALRLPGMRTRPGTTYYLIGVTVLVVLGGYLVTVIDYRRIPKDRRLAHVS